MSKSKRMTWDEIKEKYPDQWVGLTDVEFDSEFGADIKSAVVEYTDKTANELLGIQIGRNDFLVCIQHLIT